MKALVGVLAVVLAAVLMSFAGGGIRLPMASADPGTQVVAAPPDSGDHTANRVDTAGQIGSHRDPGLQPGRRYRHPGAAGDRSRSADGPDRIGCRRGRRPRRRARRPRRTARQHSGSRRPRFDTVHRRHLQRAGNRRHCQVELRSARPQPTGQQLHPATVADAGPTGRDVPRTDAVPRAGVGLPPRLHRRDSHSHRTDTVAGTAAGRPGSGRPADPPVPADAGPHRRRHLGRSGTARLAHPPRDRVEGVHAGRLDRAKSRYPGRVIGDLGEGRRSGASGRRVLRSANRARRRRSPRPS